MAGTRRLQTLLAADLDSLIAELKQQDISQLIVLGPDVGISGNPDEWPDDLKQASVVYQLQELVPDLAQRIGALAQLTSLNLASNAIGNAGAASLAALTQLTSLNLSGNAIGDAGAASLVDLTQLTYLNLGNAWLDSERKSTRDLRAASLECQLDELIQLTALELEGNSIGDAGAASLAALTQLKTLDLSRNNIGEAGAPALAGLTQLTTLKLGGNQIGDAGAAFLAGLTQLKTLDLSSNKIGEAGAPALAGLTQLGRVPLRGVNSEARLP